jgi:hypothetical protein
MNVHPEVGRRAIAIARRRVGFARRDRRFLRTDGRAGARVGAGVRDTIWFSMSKMKGV